MSKANVAQEPSMDEILASIRRIIETGEDRAGPAGAVSPVRGGEQPGRIVSPFGKLNDQSPILQEDRFASTANLPEAGVLSSEPTSTRYAFEDHPAPNAATTFVDLSKHEINERPLPDPSFERAAMVSIGSGADEDRLTAELESELAATWTHSEEPRQEPAVSAPALSPSSPESDLDQGPDGTEPMSARHHERDRSDVEAINEPDHSQEVRDPAPHVDSYRPAAEPASADEERASFQPANTDQRSAAKTFGRPQLDDASFDDPPLASGVTGSLVAASFDELAEAIRNGELRSLEAMAQDMLRPMLQDWLDDNLPKMVERLVREEIERMARGGRR